MFTFMQKIKILTSLMLKTLLIKEFCNSDWLRSFAPKLDEMNFGRNGVRTKIVHCIQFNLACYIV